MRCRGFTLFEVLAAVLILGIFYTVLADSAIRGLRSEGLDRRRAHAALIADQQLVDLETLLSVGATLEPTQDEREEGDYRVATEIVREDVDALLPAPENREEEQERSEGLERLLIDSAGNSRVYRLQVAVRWEEAGQPVEVRRTSWSFDRSELAALFPPDGAESPDGEGASQSGGGPLARGDERGSSDSRRSADSRARRGEAPSRAGGSGGNARRPGSGPSESDIDKVMRLWRELMGGR